MATLSITIGGAPLPTYDYRCDACHKTYETRESFSAPMEHECQECGKGTAKRLLSAPAIVFKGSGWYAKDSKGKSASSSDDDKTTTTSLPEAPKAETSESSPTPSSTDSSTSSTATAAS
ncbi:MAG: FmdB family zinc ribbon protein [Dehalococcoidia bacterium]